MLVPECEIRTGAETGLMPSRLESGDLGTHRRSPAGRVRGSAGEQTGQKKSRKLVHGLTAPSGSLCCALTAAGDLTFKTAAVDCRGGVRWVSGHRRPRDFNTEALLA
jgi:hypothetical protein